MNINNMNKRAFTLVELIVVVLIIAVLSALALPRFTKAVDQAKEREAINILKQIHSANAFIKAQTNSYVSGGNLNLDGINEAFGLKLIGDDMTYNYKGMDGSDYTITVTAPSGFVLKMYEGALSAFNPCCTVPTCPTTPNCS